MTLLGMPRGGGPAISRDLKTLYKWYGRKQNEFVKTCQYLASIVKEIGKYQTNFEILS